MDNVTRIDLDGDERAVWSNASARYLAWVRELWTRRAWVDLLAILPDDFSDMRAPSGRWKAIATFLVAELSKPSPDRHRLALAHFELGMHYFHDHEMGTFLRLLGRDPIEEAAHELEEAAALDPNNVEVRYELVSMYQPAGLGRGDDATRHALAARTIPPEQATSFNERPDFYLSRIAAPQQNDPFLRKRGR